MPAIQDALYYPNIHITNHRWLKTNLLTFPHILRMTPHNYVPDDDPMIAKLSRAMGARGKPLIDQYDLNTPPVYRATDILLRKLEYDLNTDPDFAKKYSVGDAWLVEGAGSEFVLHENKLGFALRDLLERNRLAVPVNDERGWLAVHPTLVSAFMSCVAAAASKERGLEIVTDDGAIHDAVASFDTSAIYDAIVHGRKAPGMLKRPRRTRLAQLVIINNFDVDALSVNDLISMSQEEDALFDFRQKVAATAKKIPEMDSEEELQSHLSHHAERLFEDWNESRSSMSGFAKRFFGMSVVKDSESTIGDIVKGFASYGTAAGAGAVVSQVLGYAPGLAVALVIRGLTVFADMRTAEKTSGLRYLTLLNKKGAATFVPAPL